jgi:hypothetical protein
MADPTESGQDMPEAGASAPPESATLGSAPPGSATLWSAPAESVPSGSAPPGSAPPVPETTPARRRRRRGGLVAVIALIILGLVGVLGGGAALARELTRKATKAEQAAAVATEIASRWQRLPAGKIFPATVSYFNAEGDRATAELAGIVPQTSCRLALEPGAFRRMHALGCAAMLRATYLDAAGAQAATVGIAVARRRIARPERPGSDEGRIWPVRRPSGRHAG